MNLELIRTVARMREFVAEARRSVGCVPTMGALHAGHGALIDRARSECGTVVTTIFVNLIQFDRQDDYERYARTLDADLAYCEARHVDAVFAPSAAEMYPEPSATFIELPEPARHLCGEFRPGHFRGVATVVAKLFNIVQPDVAYFGEKDAQQLAIIQRMVCDLNFPVRIVPVSTVREPDGLALSSRNRRLTPEERRIAPALFQALSRAAEMIVAGELHPRTVKSAAVILLSAHPAMRVEYLEVVDPRSLQPVERILGPVRVAAAVWLGGTRLIDNVIAQASEWP
jgi:pantoate--beta-alanine ligase